MLKASPAPDICCGKRADSSGVQCHVCVWRGSLIPLQRHICLGHETVGCGRGLKWVRPAQMEPNSQWVTLAERQKKTAADETPFKNALKKTQSVKKIQSNLQMPASGPGCLDHNKAWHVFVSLRSDVSTLSPSLSVLCFI